MRHLFAIILTACLVSCSTPSTSPLQNPEVQIAISALEQEAMQLLNDYIRSHSGAASGSRSAIANVEAQLQTKYPGISPQIIHAAVTAAATK